MKRRTGNYSAQLLCPLCPLISLGAWAPAALLGSDHVLLVGKLSIPPHVVTLGTLAICRGLIFVLSGGAGINGHHMSDAFKALPRTALLGFPLLSWLSLVIIALMLVVMRLTPLGRAFFAVGGNPHAAVYTGIDVGRTRFLAYCLSGTLAGLSGYLWVSRYAVAYVDIAAGFELDIIAACVIGGVSIAGGIGSVGGAVVGALVLGGIKKALPRINISPLPPMAVSGTGIINPPAGNSPARKRKGRVILRKAEAAHG